jgi:SagB-type dehydrogenase family enzyme
MANNFTKTLSNELINAAVWGNSYDVYSSSTGLGFKTHSFRHSTLDRSSRIAEDFLINSKLHRNDPELNNSVEMYLEDAGVAMVSLMGRRDFHASDFITLPESTPLDLELGEVLTLRRSVRQYTGDKINLSDLTTIIRAAAGITAKAEIKMEDTSKAYLNFRTVPSSGGLYPTDLYIAVLNVKDISPGIYCYHSNVDKLTVVGNEEAISFLLKACAVTDDNIGCARANAIFLLTSQPWRCMRKYGNRGMRFLFQECGAMSQNINLASTSLGLGSVECGSFYDDEVNKILKLDGIFRTFLHAVVVGISE